MALFFATVATTPSVLAEEACFERLDSGVDMTGWHRSAINHHGPGEGWTFEDGALVGRQSDGKRGGILMTERTFADVEVVFEVKVDWGCDSGLFFRTTGDDRAYQVNVDHLPEGGVGTLWGEMFDTELRQIPFWLVDQGNGAVAAPGQTSLFDVTRWPTIWHPSEFNEIRARVEGNPPHVQVWVSDVKVMDFTDAVLRSEVAESGPLAIQVHFGDRWANGGTVRYRNIRAKDLKRPCDDPGVPGSGGTAGANAGQSGASAGTPNVSGRGGVAGDPPEAKPATGTAGGAGANSLGEATAGGGAMSPALSSSRMSESRDAGCAVKAPSGRPASDLPALLLLALSACWLRRARINAPLRRRYSAAFLLLSAACSSQSPRALPGTELEVPSGGASSGSSAGSIAGAPGSNTAGSGAISPSTGGLGSAGAAGDISGGGMGGVGGAIAGNGGGMAGPSFGDGVGSCPVNLALRMPTVPSSESLVDGDYTTSFNFHQGGSFYVDLGTAKEIGRATIVPNVGHTWSSSYTYSISDDASNWTELVQMDALAWLPIERSFGPTTGRYFKVSINGAAWPEGALENELELYPPFSSTENLAKGKPASSNYADDVPLATDGDIGTVLDLSGANGFVAPSPAWTTVDLGEEMAVNRVRYYSSAHAPTKAYEIAVSGDNVTFRPVVHVEGDDYESFSHHCFEQRKVRYVRITVPTVRLQDASGPGTEIREIQIFGPASKP